MSVTPQQVSAFVRSVSHGIQQGWPVRSQQRVDELFREHCAVCPHFVRKSRLNGHCGLCGCIVAGDKRQINKLRCAWEECPDGRFAAEEGVQPVKGKCSGCG